MYLSILPLGKCVLLFIPLIALGWLWKNSRYRAIFRAWGLATVYSLILLPAHLTNNTAAQTQALLHIFLEMVFIGFALFLSRIRPYRERQTTEERRPPNNLRLFLAFTTAALFTYPWLAWGSLGSQLDSVLQLLTGLLFGIAAAVILDKHLFLPLLQTSSNDVANFLLGGFSAGTILLIMASGMGFAFSVMQLVLMICLPPLSWTLVGLILFGRRGSRETSWAPMAVLIGLAGAAPIVFFDADELALIINTTTGEIMGWAFKAARVSLVTGFGLGFIFLLLTIITNKDDGESQIIRLSRKSQWRPRLVAFSLMSAVVAWLFGGLIYFTIGQPGFYGEGLFVILKDQADVSATSDFTDIIERRTHVYNTLVEHADTTQASLRQSLDRLQIEYTPYYLINAIEIQAGPLLRLWLSLRPDVDRILDNPWMRPLPADPPTGTGWESAPTEPSWNLTLIRADRVWEDLGVTGEGIIIGQSDSGVEGDHPELFKSYRGWDETTRTAVHDYNWFDPWYGSTQPVDIGGHGTHTLGIIVGQNTGVAPGANWYGCVNLARNLGNPAFYLDCMQFMLAPFPLDGDPFTDGDPARGAHVTNNSWGCPEIEGCDPDALRYGVRALRAAGVFVVASAGNDGPGCGSLNTPLPIYAEAFAVGAIDQFSQLTSFSSVGPVTVDGSQRTKPDIIAPGEGVLSALPDNTYGSYSGTSMAGPHVVGVVALMWSANPSLIGDIDRTEEILSQTAKTYSGLLPECPGARAVPSTAVGYGVLDAFAAVQMALQDGTHK